MRKKIIASESNVTTPDHEWLDLEKIAEVEISSEDAAYPIEHALLGGQASGWRAAEPGTQLIRLVFSQPQSIHRIWLYFIETNTERTQEYTIRFSTDSGQSFQEVVRQQWNFSPTGSTSEIEDHSVELSAVTVLELSITPDIKNTKSVASLAQLRLA